jgi:hypothetical protein
VIILININKLTVKERWEMAVMTPTKLSIIEIFKAFIFFFFNRKEFEHLQRDDDQKRELLPEIEIPQLTQVRKALLKSLFIIILSIIIALLCGYVVIGSCKLKLTLPFILQIAGALILLWATLFVRGWEIQTLAGVTLIERMNKWIFRSMYFIGTTFLLIGIFLSTCIKI